MSVTVLVSVPRPRLHPALLLALLVSTTFLHPESSGAQALEKRQLILGRPTTVLPEHEFGSINEVAVGTDRAVFVLDGMNCEVLKVSARGELLWRSGRAGDGPGEYRSPYRIAVRPGGGVAVFDWRSNRVTLLTASGKAAATYRMPFWFSQVDGLRRGTRFPGAAVTGGPR